MTTAIVDYKAGKGTYKKYIVDRNEYPKLTDIVNELMDDDVFIIRIYENGEQVAISINEK